MMIGYRTGVMLLKVLYIDVYFLINFTVDLLALYFAASVLHIRTGVLRLLGAAALGGGYATLAIFLSGTPVTVMLLSVPTLLLFSWIVPRTASVSRRVRFAGLFLLFEIFLGGAVYYGYRLLGKIPFFSEFRSNYTAEGRRLMAFAVVALFAAGILRLCRCMLSSSCAERVCILTFTFGGKTYRVDALTDSGNLLRDPLDGTPVALVKSRDTACRSLADGLSREEPALRTRIRLIPAAVGGHRSLLTGIRPDSVLVEMPGRKPEEISMIIAFDREEGTYGGYPALVPTAAMDHGIL